ncbi:MAG: sigma-70 family RNA polymerase sigma factor [Planctomycetia bacterium]|nr:sigma-70 family RNA polymerase sigma factor [Planctomycetia bacterium]
MSLKTGSRESVGRSTASWREDPEVHLMQSVQQGDEAAFGELRKRYAGRVFSFFCRQMRDRSEAEDLTQEVFLRLYRSRVRYQPRARFATWIFHIAHNVARNAQRSRRRRPSVQLDLCKPSSQLLLEGAKPDRVGEPWIGVERAEVAEHVRNAVAGLVGRSRTAVELHTFANQTYAEVAAELEMTPKAAKSLLYRARNQLRVSLTPFVS